MPAPRPRRAAMAFLFLFHATLSGAFLVAWLSGGEDTYGMHVFAGYTVLAALAARLAAGLAAPAGSPLRLPRPSAGAVAGWLARLVGGDVRARTQRSPLLPWMAAALLAGIGVATVTGVVADRVIALEDLHEALGDASLAIVVAHIALVLGLHVLKDPAGTLSTLRATAHRLCAPRTETPAS